MANALGLVSLHHSSGTFCIDILVRGTRRGAGPYFPERIAYV